MSLIEITEAWIKDRVKITKERLDDIKSLSLPGTFDEKIFNLGPSLIHFTRLKELDLSRNVLETLDGLSHLQCLENLNLYYNNVGSLKELYKLRNNQKLTQLDLRLNPVARNEADYRLCLIHMLPLLIRLDDRCVKDEERKAALMYFGSDQSSEFSPVSAMKSEEVVSMQLRSSQSEKSHRKTHPRVHMVNRWTEGVLSDHNVAKDDNVFHLNLCDVGQYGDNTITAPRDSDLRSAKEYSPRVFNTKRLDVEREISTLRQSECSSNFSSIPVYIRSDDKNHCHNAYNKDSPSTFSSYKLHLADKSNVNGFGLHGLDQEKLISGTDQSQIKISSIINNNQNSKYHANEKVKFPVGNNHSETKYNSMEDVDEEIPKVLTDKLCDLVDRYWNGSRSLHQNPKFIAHVSSILSTFYDKKKINKNDMGYHADMKTIEISPSSLTIKTKNNSDHDDELLDLRLANKTLKEQITELRQRLNISEKVSEITELLKQSHDSLITTNEQLRKQLNNQNKRNLNKA